MELPHRQEDDLRQGSALRDQLRHQGVVGTRELEVVTHVALEGRHVAVGRGEGQGEDLGHEVEDLARLAVGGREEDVEEEVLFPVGQHVFVGHLVAAEEDVELELALGRRGRRLVVVVIILLLRSIRAWKGGGGRGVGSHGGGVLTGGAVDVRLRFVLDVEDAVHRAAVSSVVRHELEAREPRRVPPRLVVEEVGGHVCRVQCARDVVEWVEPGVEELE